MATWDPKERWEQTYPNRSKWEERVEVEDDSKVTVRAICEVMAQAQKDGLINGGGSGGITVGTKFKTDATVTAVEPPT